MNGFGYINGSGPICCIKLLGVGPCWFMPKKLFWRLCGDHCSWRFLLRSLFLGALFALPWRLSIRFGTWFVSALGSEVGGISNFTVLEDGLLRSFDCLGIVKPWGFFGLEPEGKENGFPWEVSVAGGFGLPPLLRLLAVARLKLWKFAQSWVVGWRCFRRGRRLRSWCLIVAFSFPTSLAKMSRACGKSSTPSRLAKSWICARLVCAISSCRSARSWRQVAIFSWRSRAACFLWEATKSRRSLSSRMKSGKDSIPMAHRVRTGVSPVTGSVWQSSARCVARALVLFPWTRRERTPRHSRSIRNGRSSLWEWSCCGGCSSVCKRETERILVLGSVVGLE